MKIHEFLADPMKWTRRTYARNPDGVPTYPTDPDAVCWCILGAADFLHYKATGQAGGRMKFIFAAMEAGINDIVTFNDIHTHAEVIAKLKELNL